MTWNTICENHVCVSLPPLNIVFREQVLALRFYDGSTVCVPEFIDFFTSSASTRVARAAAAAVRVSLNILQLEVDDTAATDALDSEVSLDIHIFTIVMVCNWQLLVDTVCRADRGGCC